MQNLIVFMDRFYDPGSKNASDISINGGKMCLNRFCVDEDAAFEVSGVHKSEESKYLPLEKGKGYASLK